MPRITGSHTPAHGVASERVPFYNACVLGLLARFRYVLISEDLLRDCPPEQIKALLGHELGHARHGHLWFYVVFLIASGMWAQITTDFIITFAYPLWPFIASPIGFAMVTVAIWAIMLRIGFGILSRASERQADLYGASMAGDGKHMSDALYSVARLSGMDPHRGPIGAIIPLPIGLHTLVGCATRQTSIITRTIYEEICVRLFLSFSVSGSQ